MKMECLWFSFNKIIQIELDQMKDAWNSHYIRKSRHHTASGIPNTLYFLPETVGAMVMDHKHQCNAFDLVEIENEFHASDSDDSNESVLYQDYSSYATEIPGLVEPNSWRDGLEMYQTFSCCPIDIKSSILYVFRK